MHCNPSPLWKFSSVHLASVQRHKGVWVIIIWRSNVIQEFLRHKKGEIGDLWEQTPKPVGLEVIDIRTTTIRSRRKRIWAKTLVQAWYSKNGNMSDKLENSTVGEAQWMGKQEKSRGKNGAKQSRCAANKVHENFWDRIRRSELGYPVWGGR